jgi:hypothetical protein
MNFHNSLPNHVMQIPSCQDSKPICLQNIILCATATQTPFQALNTALAQTSVLSPLMTRRTVQKARSLLTAQLIITLPVPPRPSSDVCHACDNTMHPLTPPCSQRGLGGAWRTIPVDQVTRLLRPSAECLPELNYEARDVTACSLHHGSAMALLLGGTDKDTIKLVGRWQSDAIFCYLHKHYPW